MNNKLLLVSLLVMLCITNCTAARFLQESNPVENEEEVQITPIVNENDQKVIAENNNEKTTENNNNDDKTIIPNKETDPEEPNKQEEVTKEEPQKEEEVKKNEEKKEEVKTEEENKEEPKKEGEEIIPVIPKEGENKEEEKKEEETKKEEEKKDEEEIIPINEEGKEKSYFGLSLGFCLLLAAGILFFFVGFYRYSLRKYKIPPFTPPTFCPNFLFPRPENDLLIEDYCIQSGTELGGVYSSEKYHNFY